MYLTKDRSSTSLYRSYEPRFSRHKDAEIQAYVAHTVGNDMSKKMRTTIKCMTTMIAQGISEEIKFGRKQGTLIILLKDNPDIMEKIIYTVGGVVIGAFGGYGFGKNKGDE